MNPKFMNPKFMNPKFMNPKIMSPKFLNSKFMNPKLNLLFRRSVVPEGNDISNCCGITTLSFSFMR